MKRVVIYMLLIFSSFNAIAQRFTIPHDTVRATISTSQNMYNDMTNISTDTISVSWRVSSHDFPTDWQTSFAICDNKICYYNLNGSLMTDWGGGPPKTTAPIKPGETATFYVLPDVTNASPGTHYVGVNMSEGLYSKESWYIVSKWPTGVATVVEAKEGYAVYPNPASKEFIVFHAANKNIKMIELYNVTGMKIGQYNAGENITKVNIAAMNDGIYFVRIIDNKGNIVASLKLDHN